MELAGLLPLRAAAESLQLPVLAGYISEGAPPDAAQFNVFETGIVTPRTILFHKDHYVCSLDITTQSPGSPPPPPSSPPSPPSVSECDDIKEDKDVLLVALVVIAAVALVVIAAVALGVEQSVSTLLTRQSVR